MAKICNVPTCNYTVFGGGFCKNHQYHRQDSKAPKSLKRIPIKKKYKSTGEKAVFDMIWKERKHVSFLTGLPLPDTFNPQLYISMFAHVLSKGKYPRFRLLKENILLLTPTEHRILDQGTEAEREAYSKQIKSIYGKTVDWNKIDNLKLKLIEKYEKAHR